jgi:hypothetical protein
LRRRQGKRFFALEKSYSTIAIQRPLTNAVPNQTAACRQLIAQSKNNGSDNVSGKHQGRDQYTHCIGQCEQKRRKHRGRRKQEYRQAEAAHDVAPSMMKPAAYPEPGPQHGTTLAKHERRCKDSALI